ncbi:YncE family protein [Puia sp. P3]|uniref:YncE family protein n=1 Tax=Puia sp. P3 TaxID=3423952 RepID=UPI003D6715A5
MKKYCLATLRSLLVVLPMIFCSAIPRDATTGPGPLRVPPNVHHYLYVAAPGIRNYLQYGGHGLLVYDMDDHFKFVKRISTAGLDKGQPSNVKGVAVSLYTHCIYISTIQTLQCIDLLTEKSLWEKQYEGGCDRMSVSPDGKTIYLPSFEGDDWKVLDARTGDVLHKVVTHSASHNTIYGPDGKRSTSKDCTPTT